MQKLIATGAYTEIFKSYFQLSWFYLCTSKTTFNNLLQFKQDPIKYILDHNDNPNLAHKYLANIKSYSNDQYISKVQDCLGEHDPSFFKENLSYCHQFVKIVHDEI